jgi:hypothetical protein
MKNRIVIESKDINFIRESLRDRGFRCGKNGWMRGNQPTGIFWNNQTSQWFTVIDE